MVNTGPGYAKVTKGQIQRTTREWSQFAGEPIIIEATTVDAPVRAFGSELACLRLYRVFHGKGRCAYSENLRTWYFSNK